MLCRIKECIGRVQSSRLQFVQPSAGAERLFRQLAIELQPCRVFARARRGQKGQTEGVNSERDGETFSD